MSKEKKVAEIHSIEEARRKKEAAESGITEIGEDNAEEKTEEVKRKVSRAIKKHEKKHRKSNPHKAKIGLATSAIAIILVILLVVGNVFTGGALASVNGQVSAFFAQSSTEKFSVSTDSDAVLAFKPFNSGFLLLTGADASYVNASGSFSARQQLNYNRASTDIAGRKSIVFDRGNTSYMIHSNGSIVLQKSTDESIIDAAICPAENYAIATKTEDSKTVLYGFDNGGNVIYQWNCPKGYISDVSMDKSGEKVTATIINSDNAVLNSTLYILDFNYNTEYASFVYKDETVVASKFLTSNKVLVLTDKKAYLVTNKEQEEIASFTSSDICCYDMNYGTLTAIVSADYSNDNSYKLTIISKSGKVLSTAELSGKVRGVSASSKCVSVLFSDKIETYNKKGILAGSVSDIKHFEKIIVNGNYIYALSAEDVGKFAAYGTVSGIAEEETS